MSTPRKQAVQPCGSRSGAISSPTDTAPDPTRRGVLTALLATSLAAVMPRGTALAQTAAPRVLITGANRGIGLEFARLYAERGWHVIATCRRPEEADALHALRGQHPKVAIEQLDVTDHAMIDALAQRLRGTPIDILVNNAGIGGGAENQQFGDLRYDIYREVLETNTIGPLKVAEAFLEHLLASDQKKLMNVSSSQGSIGQVRAPRLYFYRSSKSALNMLMRNLALDLAERGLLVGLLNPGPTDTDFMKGVRMPLREPSVAVADMAKIIDGFTPEMSGYSWDYDGTRLPW